MPRKGLTAVAVIMSAATIAALAIPATGRTASKPGIARHLDDRETAVVHPSSYPVAAAVGRKRSAAGGGYPRRTALRSYPVNPDDESIELGLTPYHALAPKLNQLQAVGDRVSVEVVGQSVLGRDLYLVTVTGPESDTEADQQARWRDRVEDDPTGAVRDPALMAGYKASIWINANIHGNEWEGTDGALRVIEHLATSRDQDVIDLVARTRIYFTMTANPDGRVAGTRGNAHGFDLNRDFVTASQPETVAMRQTLIETQPLMVLDEHGYVEGTLLEPTTPPHGQNYDFDLFIKHAYDNALGMEAGLRRLGHPESASPAIPFRDYAPGDWDDWAPIYTSQYSMYQAAISYTVEIPLEVNLDLPGDELRRRARVNTDVVVSTIHSTLDYLDDHRAALLANQAEMFRRGAAGEKQRTVPDGFVPGFGEEDRYTTEFPRGYVIPSGPDQRSATAAARLAGHLVGNDVRVREALAPFSVGGRSYPAGSYLVDLRQPKRALANVMLEAGRDISGRVPQMFDISGWSHRLLWGAEVDVVRTGWTAVPSREVAEAVPAGRVDTAPGEDFRLRLTGEREIRAANALLAQGVPVRRHADGSLLVRESARSTVDRAATTHGVRFTGAAPHEQGSPMRRPVVAAAVASDELYTLREVGFDVRPVSTAALNDGFDWSGVDVLVVSAGIVVADLAPAARDALTGFLARGGVVTRGAQGARFNADLGLLPVRAISGPNRANGVVSVRNSGTALGVDALPHSFAFRPHWFRDLGPGVTVEQRYAPGNPLVAGHWRSAADGTGGPEQAAGQPAVVSGTSAAGARVVMFGTEPMFRNHPKGLFSQVAQALYWTALPS